jgi:hypothetical protein
MDLGVIQKHYYLPRISLRYSLECLSTALSASIQVHYDKEENGRFTRVAEAGEKVSSWKALDPWWALGDQEPIEVDFAQTLE